MYVKRNTECQELKKKKKKKKKNSAVHPTGVDASENSDFKKNKAFELYCT